MEADSYACVRLVGKHLVMSSPLLGSLSVHLFPRRARSWASRLAELSSSIQRLRFQRVVGALVLRTCRMADTSIPGFYHAVLERYSENHIQSNRIQKSQQEKAR